MTDVRAVLDRLGIEVLKDRDTELLALCPAHEARTGHPDTNPSWWINSETGAHLCFSCGYKGSITSLIIDVDKVKPEELGAWFKETFTYNLQDRLERATKKKETSVFKEVQNITEAHLAAFIDPPIPALQSRGLTLEAAQTYGIKWDKSWDKWILPIRDPKNGKLWGWQEKGTVFRSFLNYPTGVKKAHSLFGYQEYACGTMIVVESPLDVVRLASVGITGGVATYGSVFSSVQLEYIRGAEKVLVAMDNDAAGQESTDKFYQASKQFGFNCWFFNYSQTDQKDIGGMSADEIKFGIENSINKLRYRKVLA